MAVEFKIILADDPNSTPRSASGAATSPAPQDVEKTRQSLQSQGDPFGASMAKNLLKEEKEAAHAERQRQAEVARVEKEQARMRVEAERVEQERKAKVKEPYNQAAGAMGRAGGMGDVAAATSAAGDLAAGASNPIGAAITIAKVAAGRLSEILDDTRDSLRHFGEQTVRMTNNDYMGMFNAQVDKASASLEKIPIIGQVWSAQLQLAVQPIRTFTEVVNAFVARGEQLKAYSVDLAQASATANVRSMASDMREADVLGPGIAELTDAQSRLWNEMREFFLPLKDAIVKVLIPFANGAANLMEGANAVNRAIYETLQIIAQVMKDVLEGNLAQAVKHIAETTERIRTALEKKDPPDTLMENLHGVFGQSYIPPDRHGDPQRAAAMGALNRPQGLDFLT